MTMTTQTISKYSEDGFVMAADAKPKYRSDIDGLRAFAVIAVVAYHFHVPFFRGGFIGVDVFFVISGFLITKIISLEISKGNFTYKKFYTRRVRRIFPALFVVYGSCVILMCLIGFPVEVVNFSKALISAVFFSSNIYFMYNINYFGDSILSMPLLHTWSLAVEEQFYLVFPVILVLLEKFDSKWSRLKWPIIFSIAIISFVVSAYTAVFAQKFAFYSIISRAWELMIGSALAFGLFPRIKNKLLLEFVGLFGILCLMFAVFRFHDAIIFPGVFALFPCVGSAALIYCGGLRNTLVSKILSNKILVFIGLISYSLYLWHWPIIVFYGFYSGTAIPDALTTLLLIVLSIMISTLSWRYIEQPFRKSVSDTSNKSLYVSAVAIVATAAISLILITYKGFPQRYTPDQDRLQAYLEYDPSNIYRDGICFIDFTKNVSSDFDKNKCLKLIQNKQNVILMGDSHAAHLYPGIADTFPNYNILQATASGCKPLIENPGVKTCTEIRNWVFREVVVKPEIDIVILSARWVETDLPALLKTVDYLAKQKKRILVSGPVMEYRMPLPRLLAQAEALGSQFVRNAQQNEISHIDEKFRLALSSSATAYFSTYGAVCSIDKTCLHKNDEGIPLQWDRSHLTYQGSIYLARHLKQQNLLDNLTHQEPLTKPD